MYFSFYGRLPQQGSACLSFFIIFFYFLSFPFSILSSLPRHASATSVWPLFRPLKGRASFLLVSLPARPFLIPVLLKTVTHTALVAPRYDYRAYRCTPNLTLVSGVRQGYLCYGAHLPCSDLTAFSFVSLKPPPFCCFFCIFSPSWGLSLEKMVA